MRELPIAARVYVTGVVVAACTALALRLPEAQFSQPWVFVALLLLSSVTSAFKLDLPLSPGRSSISVTYAVNFLALLILPPVETLLITIASAWSQCTFRMHERNPLHQTIFSIASLTLTVQAAIVVYVRLGGTPGQMTGGLLDISQPLVGAAATYFLLNTVLVAGAVSLSTKTSPGRTWLRSFMWSAPSYFVGAGAAGVAAWALTARGPWLLPLMAAPLYLTYLTYRVYVERIDDERRHVQQMSDLHLATIEALALAIDAKDQMAHDHIRRVQVYATALARALGMSDDDVQGVKTAALLHDIGKLAVPEHILVKPGPLTAEEFQKVRIHPQVGAEIIGRVPFPYPVAPIILSHHERWDGRGYPHGLKGDSIPLGARILTVVDYYDALTSDRPYHKRMAWEAAQSVMRQEAGQALDPTAVDTFLRLLPALRASVDRMSMPGPALSLDPPPGDAEPAPPEKAESPTVFENIALAHREIYALYEIAQTMGTSLGVADTMALISSKMTNLVPFSACALFAYTESTDSLRCRFATGIDAELLRPLVIPSGQGLVGWVARNRRPLVNARPAADLESTTTGATTTLQSALVCPLIFGELFIGTLAVYHEDPGAYRDDHRRLLDRVCEQAAAVIHNAIVFERTQADSLTDPLTGLPNTRFMFLHLTRELARADRLESEVSLLVLDLDDFKEINDTYGHQIGDRALRDIAGALRGAIRPYDICVRYAGDEFIVLLPGCGREEAERKRLDLEQRVAKLVFEPKPGERLHLSISAGAAVFPEDGRTYEALLGKADTRMYANKGARKVSGAASRQAREARAVVQPVRAADELRKSTDRA
jgi:diguanylate cyclase (GGDEF)-like protein/putative nucleotidyltransferase with HDIG domain